LSTRTNPGGRNRAVRRTTSRAPYRHQVRRDDDPEQLVAESGPGGEIRGEVARAQGPTLNGKEEIIYVSDAQRLTDHKSLGPVLDPGLFVTYDGSMGKGKPGTGAGATGQGVANEIKAAMD